MNSLFQLEIPKRNHCCFHQGERLLPGMDMYSLLLEDDHQRLIRRDFCSACWKQQEKEGIQVNRGYWKSTIEHQRTQTKSSRVNQALALLRNLLNASEKQEAEIFVLCLFLSHARQLALRQEFQREGDIYQLYEILQQEEYVTIKVIHLSPVDIENLQKSLASKFSHLERIG